MPAFVGPLANVVNWTLSDGGTIEIPAGLRYGGYSCPTVSATAGAEEDVLLPATGILRSESAGNRVFVEIQPNPFPIREVAMALLGGLPTFYLVFDDADQLTFSPGDAGLGGELLRSATRVTLAAIHQDRVMRNVELWCTEIENALATEGGDTAAWQPFATAVRAALTAGASSPVYLYDHAGSPRTEGTLEVLFGTTAPGSGHAVTLEPQDGGDLQRAVARLSAAPANPLPISSLWGGGESSFRLRPAQSSAQLVRLEDGLVGESELVVTRAQRSVSYTDLDGWFAPQFATLANGPALQRYSRGNRLTPLVNGIEFFDDLCLALRDAQDPSGAFHLAGWSMFPQTKLTRLHIGEDPHANTPLDMANAQLGEDNVPLTLEQAAALIGAAGGGTRFLPAEFIQIRPGQTLSSSAALTLYALTSGILIFNRLKLDFARTDATGAVLTIAIWAGASIYVDHVLREDGDPFEPNDDALKTLSAFTNAELTNAVATLAPYPARVEDNVPPADLDDFPLSALVPTVRHFGVQHQKFALVKTPSGLVGYCGGIDVNPNRLDDEHHLARSPYHDVHARVDGNAARDLAATFQERWENEGEGDSAFDPPGLDGGLAPGEDIVQVARTYFAPAVGANHGLPYAPTGDRTIADTMLAAIRQAREFIYIEDQYLVPPDEYQDALVEKVTNREIRQLIIVNDQVADQPFSDTTRQAFVTRLFDADAGAGIVRVGYPRRRFVSTDNELRADSGKLLLMQDLPASAGALSAIFLGPPARIPALPFWVSVEGELIYVYDESVSPNPNSQVMRAYACERGPSTHLVRGGANPEGTFTREHKRGAAATVVDLSAIYVHAKLMIVDDVFVGIGSANLNNRGLFYDGELNLFSVPAALRLSARNPARQLRQRLWAEMLDLPETCVAPLLQDPLASETLFDRHPLAGNRFVPLDAQPPNLMLSWTSGDGAFMTILQGLGFAIVASDLPMLFEQVADPASRTKQP